MIGDGLYRRLLRWLFVQKIHDLGLNGDPQLIPDRIDGLRGVFFTDSGSLLVPVYRMILAREPSVFSMTSTTESSRTFR